MYTEAAASVSMQSIQTEESPESEIFQWDRDGCISSIFPTLSKLLIHIGRSELCKSFYGSQRLEVMRRENAKLRQRKSRSGQSPMKKEEVLEANKLSHQKCKDSQSPIKRKEVMEANKLSQQKSRASQSPMKKKIVMEANKLSHQKSRDSQSPMKRKSHQQEDAARKKMKYQHTPEKNVKNLTK